MRTAKENSYGRSMTPRPPFPHQPCDSIEKAFKINAIGYTAPGDSLVLPCHPSLVSIICRRCVHTGTIFHALIRVAVWRGE